MQRLDWEDQILLLAQRVLKKLTVNEVHLARMMELGVPKILIEHLDAQFDKPDVLSVTLGTLCQMANPQTARKLLDLGLLKACYRVILEKTEREELVDGALQV
jgi:hypothetical protein